MQNASVWPFFGLEDEQGSAVPYICLQGPLRTPDESRAFDRISGRFTLIGFTSYMTFPGETCSVDARDYAGMCSAWCHCFRDPQQYLPPSKPAHLLAFSDFLDFSRARPEVLFSDREEKRWDFAYVCQAGAWKSYVKNWDLARRCLPILCHDLGLHGVLIGRDHVPDLPDCGERLTILGELPWRDLMSVFWRSRFLFVPNVMDASPRIIAEALCMNIPVLVNRNILGGWHYVNPFTGFFFEDEHDVASGARSCLEEWTSPRRWFTAHHGPLLAGERLARFLGQFDRALKPIKRLQIKVHASTEPSTSLA
jgi:glycosyltransferase involved in cell wall biosynthesis